jgi:hypothetical protein
MVNRFADAHSRFDELGKAIEMALIAGFGLKEAYAVAVALDGIGSRRAENAKQKRKAGAHHASGRAR